MNKSIIYIVAFLIITFGSVAQSADAPKLDTKTTLSILNIVIGFYSARYHGDIKKIQSMFDELNPYWRKRYSSASNYFDSEKIEFTELTVLSEEPFKVEVVIKFSYGLKAPPNEYLMVLLRIGNQWKIIHYDGLGLP